MNMLSANIKTMTSREIAELTGKEHKNVKRDIRNLIDELKMGALKIEQTYYDQQGRAQIEFYLDKELTTTLVSGYSITMRHSIVRRWQELEQQHKLPETFAQALQLAADQQLQIESLATKIKGDRPKVVFANKWMDSPETHSLTQAAKLIDLPPKYLIEMMAKDKIIFKRCEGSGWEPYQRRIDQGLMILKPVEHGKNTFKQAKVTGKGLIFLNKRYGEEL